MTPELTGTPDLTLTPELTVTPELTGTPELTITPELTGTPEFTLTPELTITPELTLTLTPTATEVLTPTVTPTPTVVETLPLTEIVPLPGPLYITPGKPPVVGVKADPPGNPSDEFVVIANGDSTQEMGGWTLANGAGDLYTFPLVALAPNGYLRIWTGNGVDAGSELYWGRDGDDLWNPVADIATLRDAAGNVVSVCPYTAEDLTDGMRVCPDPLIPPAP